MMDNTTSYFMNSTVSLPTSESFTEPDDYDYGGNDGSTICEFPQHGSYFLPWLYSLFFIVGLLGNVLVLWVIIFGVQLRSMSDVCLLNLAFADLLLVCSLPFLAHQELDQWLFGDVMCKMVLGIYHIGFYCGIFFISLMSIDRYLAVVHAIYALKIRTRTSGMIAAAITWVAGFLASFPDLGFLQVQEFPSSSNNTTLICAPLYTASAGNDPTTQNSHFWNIFGLFKMNILGLLIPMTIMVFCYSQIIWKLLYSHSSKKQSIRLVLVVVAVFFCCWMPYNVASFFKALELLHVYAKCKSSKAIRLTLEVTQAIAYSHSCINPILYVFIGEKFRRNLLRLMNRAPCRVCQVMKTLIPPDKVTGSTDSQTTSVGERSPAM